MTVEPDQIVEMKSLIEQLKKDCALKNKEIGRLRRNGGPASSLTVLETNFKLDFDFTTEKSVNSKEVELAGITTILTFGEHTESRSGQKCHYLKPQIKAHDQTRMTIFTTTYVMRKETTSGGVTTIYTDESTFDMVNSNAGECETLTAKKAIAWATDKVISKGNINCVMKIVYDGSARILPYQEIDDIVVLRFSDKSTIQAHSGCLSMWSSYFAGYLRSEMKEAKEGVFPVEDFTAEEFRELLDVISPSSKPIDSFNLEKLLDMADRYLMPNLTKLCEIFLTDRTRHTLTDIAILQYADEYNLHMTRAIILEKMKTTADMKSKIVQCTQYAELSHNMKSAIGARFVELNMAGK